MILDLYITFEDLSSEKQEDIISRVKVELIDLHKEEGEKYEKVAWNAPKPESWKEAYVRSYSISHIMWDDYEAGDVTERPNFEELFDEHVEEEARKMSSDNFRALTHILEVSA